MRAIRSVAGLIAVLIGAGAVRSDDQAEMKAVLARAIEAQGGAELLNKYKAVQTQVKGKIYATENGLDYTGEVAFQIPDRLRVEMDLEVMTKSIRLIEVLNGDKGWISTNGKTMPVDKDLLNELREQLYTSIVTRLEPLHNKDYKLSPLGEATIGDSPAVGVRVERAGRRAINLYFDKKSGLLLKSEMRLKIPPGGNNEITAETFYSDYRKVQGMMVAYKSTVKHDGKVIVENATREVTLAETLEDSLFEKP